MNSLFPRDLASTVTIGLPTAEILMIKRNIVFGIISQGLLLLLSLIATRLVFHELGAEVLGIISFSVTLTFLFIAFSDMGMSLLVIREVAAHRRHDAQYVEALVGAVIGVAWFAFLISSALGIALAPWLVDNWLQIEAMNRSYTILALQLISAALLLAIPRAVYGAVLSGYERVDLWNIANLWAVAIQQLGLILVLASGGGVLHVSSWFGVSAVLGLIPFMYLVYRMGGIRLLLPTGKIVPLMRNVRFAMHLFGNSFSGFLVTQVDKWTISRFLPVSLFGYYSFAQGLVSKGGIVPGAIAHAAFPALSTGHGVLTGDAWRTQYRKLQDLTCYVYFPVTAAVAMLGIVVTRLVFNAEIAELVWYPLLLLSVGQYLLGLLSVPYWLAVAAKRPDISTRTNLWALLLIVPVTVVLVYLYGLTGAAGSSVLYATWQLLYFVPRFCTECLGTRASLWYRQAGAYFVLGMAAYGASWTGAWALGEGLTFTGLVCAYIVGTVVFLFAGWSRAEPELRAAVIHSMRALRAG